MNLHREIYSLGDWCLILTPSSQLFKRLSSYAKDHPLYKTLKEFGRIIKSIFILTYYDEVELRQRNRKATKQG